VQKLHVAGLEKVEEKKIGHDFHSLGSPGIARVVASWKSI
jgi:hypothetical protein